MEFTKAIEALNTHSEAGQIRDYLRSKAEGYDTPALSETLAAKLERVEACKKLITTVISTDRILARLMQDFSISRRQAYKDLQDCKTIFGERQIWEEALFLQLQESRLVAMHQGDVRGLNASDKNMMEAIAKFKGTEESDFWKQMQPPVMVLAEIPEPEIPLQELEAKVQKRLRSRQKNAGYEKLAEDVSYEEVKPPAPQEEKAVLPIKQRVNCL